MLWIKYYATPLFPRFHVGSPSERSWYLQLSNLIGSTYSPTLSIWYILVPAIRKRAPRLKLTHLHIYPRKIPVIREVFLCHDVGSEYTLLLPGPFLDLTLIPAGKSNHMPSKVWNEIINAFPNNGRLKCIPRGISIYDSKLRYAELTLGLFKLIRFNLNPSMDTQSHSQQSVGWSSVSKLGLHKSLQ